MAPSFVRATVRAMDAPEAADTPGPSQRVVKLNTFENPFPPSPRVLEAVRQIEPEQIRRYPQPLADTFRATAAKVLGVEPEMILCGNGCDEILAVAARALVSHGATLAAPSPTYPLFESLSKLQDAKFAAVDWADSFALPVEELLATKPAAIFLANPNTPSGTSVSVADIATLCGKFRGAVVVDEAFADFADENCLPLLAEHENLVLARSMSKGYALAGLRFGYAIARPRVIDQLQKAQENYSCDAIATLAATAAIEDREHAQRSWDHVRGERARLSEELMTLGWSVLTSTTNFIVATPPGAAARAAFDGLKSKGILVRWSDDIPQMRDKLQITIGNSLENNALLAGIQSLRLGELAA